MSAWVFSIFHTRNSGTMILLYESLVRCHLEYCSPLWNSTPTLLGPIKNIGAQWLMSLQRQRERFIVLHMWKICNGKAPNELNIRFEYHPRMGLTAKVPPLRKHCALANQTLYENSFGMRGQRMWNCIPADIRVIKIMDTFKSKITQSMLSVPDTPPIRGNSLINLNRILEWRNNRDEY